MINILNILVRIARNITFKMMVFMAALHALAMYFLFMLAGETDLTSHPVSFIYYYIVTSSTIGYGDMSPSSPLGQALASFALIPLGVTIFAAMITKMVSLISSEISKIYNGYGKMNMKKDHTVIIGYNGTETEKVIQELLHFTEKQNIVVVNNNDSRPSDPEIGFIRTEYFGRREDMERAGILNAKNVIIKCDDDGSALHACVAVVDYRGDNFNGVVFFKNQETASMVENRFKSFETIVSNVAAQISRSVVSPGSSQVINGIVSKDTDSVLLSYEWKESYGLSGFSLAEIGRIFAAHNAVLIAIGDKHHSKLVSDYENSIDIKTGDHLFYIAKEPIKELKM